MPRIDNDFTRLLGIELPIVCAPMANVGGAKLAVEATLGGGFGFMGAGYWTPDKLRSELALARTLLTEANRVSADTPLPVGVALFGWKLDAHPDVGEQMLDALVEANIQAVWFSFGDNLGPWIEKFRAKDRARHSDSDGAGAGKNTVVFVLVNSVDEARRAIDEWKADVIVAQGIESGGHGASSAPPLHSFLTSLLLSASSSSTTTYPPILAAGGLSSGSHAAALLTLGAAGAVYGTRFLLTPESLYTSSQKAALLAATASDTVRTEAFDVARGTTGWPVGVDGRGLRNALVEDFKGGVEVEEVKKRFEENVRAGGDPGYAVVWAGTGVGEMREVRPAKDVMRQLGEDMFVALKRVREIVVDV